MPRPSVKQLEYFSAVARHGSFRRASENLGISQPTITAQVAQLEKTLGVSLFERGRSGATLSPAGRQLIRLARTVLEELDELMDSAGAAAQGGSKSEVYELRDAFGLVADEGLFHHGFDDGRLPHVLQV